MLKYLQKFFYKKNVANLDVESNEIIKHHYKIINNNKLLHSAYKTFYLDMCRIQKKFFKVDGLHIELGSGVGFFKKYNKKIITSDIRSNIRCDKKIDATNMDLKSNSVSCIFAINVFHHLTNIDKFFNEIGRVLKKNGGCILIEPHIGFMSKLIFSNIHKSEYFDENEKILQKKKDQGSMSLANQAMAYIYFEREKVLFKRKYGKKLAVIHSEYVLNGFRYILSGGLNFKQVVPSFMEPLLIFLEKILKPFAVFFMPYKIIVLKKIN